MIDLVKPTLIDALNNNRDGVNITFTKVNGEIRNMHCTLNNFIIPEEKRLPEESYEDWTEKFNKTSLRVFDIEIQEWRAFRWDSLIFK